VVGGSGAVVISTVRCSEPVANVKCGNDVNAFLGPWDQAFPNSINDMCHEAMT